MRHKFARVVALVAVCVGVVVTGASAQHHPDSVVPLFCTSDTIPAGSELKLRIRWAVKSPGQASKFLQSQKLSWTVSAPDGTVLASRDPAGYGDLTYWSGPIYTEVILADGTRQKIYASDYLVSTGVTLAAGQTVTVAHLLIANAKTDDGFGNNIPANTPLSSKSNCTVTGI
jgi:hypothetical protein